MVPSTNISKTSVLTLNVRGLNNNVKRKKKSFFGLKIQRRILYYFKRHFVPKKQTTYLNLAGMVQCLTHALTRATAEE